MKRQTTLLALGAANLAALTAIVLTWPAGAQQPAATPPNKAPVKPLDTRARGDYTMVSGRIGAGGNHVVYVVDSSNQEMIALRWDTTKQVFIGIGYRNLATDGKGARGR